VQDLIDTAKQSILTNRDLLRRLQGRAGMPVALDSEDETFRAFSDALQEWDSQVGLQAGTSRAMSFGALLQLLIGDAGRLVSGFCSNFSVRFRMCALILSRHFKCELSFAVLSEVCSHCERTSYLARPLAWRCRRSGGMAVVELFLKDLGADVRTRLSNIGFGGSSTNEEA
jgi:hypothetical protein